MTCHQILCSTETSGDVECEFGDDENCNFPSASGDGPQQQDSEVVTTDGTPTTSESSEETTVQLPNGGL